MSVQTTICILFHKRFQTLILIGKGQDAIITLLQLLQSQILTTKVLKKLLQAYVIDLLTVLKQKCHLLFA